MKQNIKQKWLRALRSGLYKQGKHRLRSINDEYCCLGVLCDIAVKEGVTPEPTIQIGGKAYRYDSRSSSLPADVVEWAGISTHTGWYDNKHSLAGDNDSGKLFKEIADIIEEHF